jgi:hypothetical protein
MIQNLRSYRSLNVTADNTPTILPDRPCRLVVIRNSEFSADTIKIHGVANGIIDTDGISLAIGETFSTLWMDNLNQIAVVADDETAVVEILYGV